MFSRRGRRFLRGDAVTPVVAALVGVVSGAYAFDEPLRTAAKRVEEAKRAG